MRRLPRPGAALLALLLAASGCQGFERLERDDPTVTEDEVFAAGRERDRADLAPHLRNVLGNPARYLAPVVVAAIVAVRERGDRASAPELEALARSEDEEVRWHAARALESLEARERIPAGGGTESR